MCLHTAVMSCVFVSVKLGLPELEVVFFPISIYGGLQR